jgi:hypothetical protein
VCDSLACYLARRYGALYAGETDTPEADVRRAFGARGVQVFVRPRVGDRGYFVNEPEPHVVLGARAGLLVSHHEFAHAWLFDNVEHGVEYAPADWQESDEEEVAGRFAEYLGSR